MTHLNRGVKDYYDMNSILETYLHEPLPKRVPKATQTHQEGKVEG